MRESLIVRRWRAHRRYARSIKHWSVRGVGPFLDHLYHGVRHQPALIYGKDKALRQMVLQICFRLRPGDVIVRRQDGVRWPSWVLFVLRFGYPQAIRQPDIPTVGVCLQVMSQQPGTVARLCFGDEDMFREALETAFSGETQDAPQLSAIEQAQLDHIQAVAEERLARLQAEKSYSVNTNWLNTEFKRFNQETLDYILPPVLQPMLQFLNVSEAYLPARASDFEAMIKMFAIQNNDEGFALALKERDIYYARRRLTKRLGYLSGLCLLLGIASVGFSFASSASFEHYLLFGEAGLMLILVAIFLMVSTIAHRVWCEASLVNQINRLRQLSDEAE